MDITTILEAVFITVLIIGFLAFAYHEWQEAENDEYDDWDIK